MAFVVEALRGFGEWLLSGLSWLANQIASAISSFFYNFFVLPIINFVNFVIDRLRQKIRGIIFIVITVPLMIREAKKLIEKPSFGGVLKLAMKPLFGYLASQVLGAVIESFLKPIVIAPPPPPVIPQIQPYAPPRAEHVDTARIEDSIELSLREMPTLTDSVGVEDSLTLELARPLALADSVEPTDILLIWVESRA